MPVLCERAPTAQRRRQHRRRHAHQRGPSHREPPRWRLALPLEFRDAVHRALSLAQVENGLGVTDRNGSV